MMKRAFIPIAVCAACFCHASLGHATLAIISSVGGHPASGVNYVTFDDLALGGGGGFASNTPGSLDYGGLLDGITVSFNPDAKVVQGALGGKYAAPVLSNNNGANFGGQPNGVDGTDYITSSTV